MTKFRVDIKIAPLRTANVWHQRHLVCLDKTVTIFNYLKNIHENRQWFDKSFYAVQNVYMSVQIQRKRQLLLVLRIIFDKIFCLFSGNGVNVTDFVTEFNAIKLVSGLQ